jgi:hypothetical protein
MDNVTDESTANTVDWDRECTDIPVSSPEVGTSVPSPEEMRTAGIRTRSSGKSCNKLLFLLSVAVLVIVVSLLIAMAVGTGAHETNDHSLEEVISFVSQSGVSDQKALVLSGTPQNRAATWIAEQDEADWAVPTDAFTSLDHYKYLTRYIMAVLYFSTGGSSWETPLGFMTSEDVCDWNTQMTNGYTDYRKGVVCDDTMGLVYALFLGT